MSQAQAMSDTSWFEASDTRFCPKCTSRMNKVSPIQGLSALSERILQCPKCHYITLSARPLAST